MATSPFRISPPQYVSTKVALEPVYNALLSLSLLNAVELFDGLTATSVATKAPRSTSSLTPTSQFGGIDAWVIQTAAALTPEQRHRNRLVFEGLGDVLVPESSWPDFPSYVDDLAAQNPVTVRDRMFQRITRQPDSHDQAKAPSTAALLADATLYVEQLARMYPNETIDEALQLEAHRLLNDPPALHELIVSHLRDMWINWLALEWSRREALLRGLIQALSRRTLPEATAADTIRAFIGRDLPPDISVQLADIRRVIFVPTPHIGLYASRFGSDATIWVFVNPARITGWSLRQSPVNPRELLTKLLPLADETRLRILELLAQHGELSAQELIARLELSQSSVSRHVKQLDGYIVERRAEGANKVYRLNPDTLDTTFGALKQFLSRDDTDSALVGPRQTRREEMEQPVELKRFVNREGRVELWPSKRKDQRMILQYLADKFESDREYTEKEVNNILQHWMLARDSNTLRRDLYDERLLDRSRDGARYWRPTVD